MRVRVCGEDGDGYSFAKTPLKAAQAPLAAARASQEFWKIIGRVMRREGGKSVRGGEIFRDQSWADLTRPYSLCVYIMN